mgnify:CR=1 FL=1
MTPGTRLVTVGGALAADVHGKNHHRDGSWGHHVLEIDLLLADGSLVTVSRTSDAALFWATIGGMGLTGVILGCRFMATPVTSSRLLVDTWRTVDLDETMSLMEEHDANDRYTVAWVDATGRGARLGRGVVTMADHAPASAVGGPDPLAFSSRTRVSVPCSAPSWLLNRFTIAAFNEAWFRRAPRRRVGELQSLGSFFHPLDAVGNWNRLYGRGGMLQYQFLVPAGEEATLRFVVEQLVERGAASFLTVLKRFGSGNEGHLSFPAPGWTLTLDVPTGIAGLGGLLDDVDRVVVDVGGRVYLAKDSRLDRRHLHRMYPRIDEWRDVCARVDPRGALQSDLSRRLGLRERGGNAPR